MNEQSLRSSKRKGKGQDVAGIVKDKAMVIAVAVLVELHDILLRPTGRQTYSQITRQTLPIGKTHLSITKQIKMKVLHHLL